MANRLSGHQKAKYSLEYSHFNNNSYVNDLEAVDLSNNVTKKLNENMICVIYVPQCLIDKQARLRKLSDKNKK